MRVKEQNGKLSLVAQQTDSIDKAMKVLQMLQRE
jgi:hypothetical protein